VLADNEIKPLGKIPGLNKAILDTKEGYWTEVIEKDKKWYLAGLTSVTCPTERLGKR
jgi:hypothetical protein